MNNIRKIFIFVLFLTLEVGPLSLQAQVPSLRDLKNHRTPQDETVSIAIIIDEIRQGIQFKNAENITRHLDKDFNEPGQVSGKDASKAFFTDFFDATLSREIVVPDEELTELWDFDVTEVEINIKDSTTAVVSCDLIFHTLAEDSTKANIAKAEERFALTKDHRSRWKLRNSRKLFGFLLGILEESK